MNLEDIIWSISQYNRLGRSTLKDVGAKPFDSGNIALNGGQVTFDVFPPTGFIRRWEQLVAVPSATAASDRMFLVRANRELNVGSVMMAVEFPGALSAAALNIPLIAGRLVTPGFAVPVNGVEPFWYGNESLVRVVFIPVAPVAQTLRVFGWYKDIAY